MYDNFAGPSRQRGYTAAAVWFSIDTSGLLPGIPVQNQPTCCGNARVTNDRENTVYIIRINDYERDFERVFVWGFSTLSTRSH